jgi:hypothetical protein
MEAKRIDPKTGLKYVSPQKGDDESDGTKSVDGDALMERLDTLVSAVSEITDRLKDNEERVDRLSTRFSKMAAVPDLAGKSPKSKHLTASAYMFGSEESPSSDKVGRDGAEFHEL